MEYLSVKDIADKWNITIRQVQKLCADGRIANAVEGDIWSEAQAERKRRAEQLGRNKNYFAVDKTKISPFWGIVFCADCGREFRRYADKGNRL